ncbi:(2Fe-2S) ferredoxin domain-containing protein [Pulveribacter sp.]|uniref:(2Fe-2S) ferredoxin domain-containing protein n=1 Tax=Pulveribacter sp. TaxID=2678893 RepID=UPI0028AB7482|nr:(2Fe-2S) ferredoxin domain-containing protein [Pulveribacter sp.]
MTAAIRPPPTDHASVAIVLLGRGGVAASTTAELAGLAQQLAAQWPGVRVQPAFVDRWQPDLPTALGLCADADTIVILPLMLPDEAALRRWLHKVAMRWRAGRDQSPTLIFGEPLAQAVALPELLAAAARQALDLPDVATLVDEDWRHDPKGWSSVPEHTHHALWCIGPRCAAAGAVALWPVLTGAINQNPALKKRVRPLQTSCQYPCNHGPLMIVYPEGVWYGPLGQADIGRVLAQHVAHQQVVQALRVHGPKEVTNS